MKEYVSKHILAFAAKLIVSWKIDSSVRTERCFPKGSFPHPFLDLQLVLYDKVTFLWTTWVSVISFPMKLVLSQMCVIPVVKLLHAMLQGLYRIQQPNRKNILHRIKCQIFSDTPVAEWQPKTYVFAKVSSCPDCQVSPACETLTFLMSGLCLYCYYSLWVKCKVLLPVKVSRIMRIAIICIIIATLITESLSSNIYLSVLALSTMPIFKVFDVLFPRTITFQLNI